MYTDEYAPDESDKDNDKTDNEQDSDNDNDSDEPDTSERPTHETHDDNVENDNAERDVNVGNQHAPPRLRWDDYKQRLNDGKGMKDFGATTIEYADALINMMAASKVTSWNARLTAMVDVVRQSKLKDVNFQNAARQCTINTEGLNLCAHKTQVMPMIWFHMMCVANWIEKPDKGPDFLTLRHRQVLLALLTSGLIAVIPPNTVVKTMEKGNPDVDFAAFEKFVGSYHFRMDFVLVELLCLFIARFRLKLDDDVTDVMQAISDKNGKLIAAACNKGASVAKTIFRCKNVEKHAKNKFKRTKVVSSLQVYNPRSNKVTVRIAIGNVGNVSNDGNDGNNGNAVNVPDAGNTDEDHRHPRQPPKATPRPAKRTRMTTPSPSPARETVPRAPPQVDTPTPTPRTRSNLDANEENTPEHTEDDDERFRYEAMLEHCLFLEFKNKIHVRSEGILKDLTRHLDAANSKRSLYVCLMMMCEAATILTEGMDSRIRRIAPSESRDLPSSPMSLNTSSALPGVIEL